MCRRRNTHDKPASTPDGLPVVTAGDLVAMPGVRKRLSFLMPPKTVQSEQRFARDMARREAIFDELLQHGLAPHVGEIMHPRKEDKN